MYVNNQKNTPFNQYYLYSFNKGDESKKNLVI